jgi:hypothetical protein
MTTDTAYSVESLDEKVRFVIFKGRSVTCAELSRVRAQEFPGLSEDEVSLSIDPLKGKVYLSRVDNPHSSWVMRDAPRASVRDASC